MSVLNIRDVPPELMAELKKRAIDNHETLREYVVRELSALMTKKNAVKEHR